MSQSLANGASKTQNEAPSTAFMVHESDPDQSGVTTIDTAAQRRLMWKVDLHVVPILFVIYIFAFLDRVNIGNARIQVRSPPFLVGAERRELQS